MLDQDPTIAGYRILERPSAGGVANIYRAPRETDGATVVLKVTNAEYPQAEGLTRFLHDREQQVAYALTPEAEKPALHLRVGNFDFEAAVETITDIEDRLP